MNFNPRVRLQMFNFEVGYFSFIKTGLCLFSHYKGHCWKGRRKEELLEDIYIVRKEQTQRKKEHAPY